MLILRLGDPHVQHNNISESHKLMEFVYTMCVDHKVDRVEILGDLHHTHGIIRLEVLEFWEHWLRKLVEKFQLVALVGNHDLRNPHDNTSYSMSTHRFGSGEYIISKPELMGIYGYLPYIHDKDTFVKEANKLVDIGAKVLVCHQTFFGAKFESGMFAPDGIDVSLINCPLIISGHLHSRQKFANIIYPGTARWLTQSDANEPKGLWLVEHDNIDGHIIKEKYLDTSTICTPIFNIKWLEGQEKPDLVKNAKTTIELVGTSDWIAKQKSLLKGTCSISTKVTDTKKTRWKPKKSENTLESFIKQQFNISSGLNKEILLSYMREEFELV